MKRWYSRGGVPNDLKRESVAGKLLTVEHRVTLLQQLATTQRDYFAFLSWLYISPFMSDLLAEGLRADHSPHKYPLYAVLMGKSSSGKTTAAQVFLRSMIGPNLIDRPGQDLGKRNLRGLGSGKLNRVGC